MRGINNRFLYVESQQSKMGKKTIDRAIVATCIFGVLVSTYALYVEMAVEAHPEYKAMCDISEYASCSRVLTSEYSKGFGILPEDSTYKIPNAIYGTAFYCLIIFLTTFDQLSVVRLQVLLAVSSAATSVYLAYILAFVLHDICIVCISTYIVNGFLVYFTFQKMKFFTVKNK